MLALGLGAVYFALRPTYAVLFQDLRPADAATIVAQLEQDKTPYRLRDGGTTILTTADRVDAVRLEIMGAELPLKGAVGFELFNKSDMGLTEFAQRINYQRALQGELARTIMTMDGVESARVHLTLPEPSVFRADRKPAKASVALIPRRGRTLPAAAVTGVQRVVAAAVPDLDPAAVVVVDATGAPIDVAAGASPEGDAATPTLVQTRAIETFYEAALRRALEPLYPTARIAVLIPLDQWGFGMAADLDRQAAVEAWSQDSRGFRLQIRVSMPGGLSPAQREVVERVAADVAGFDSQRGDALQFAEWALAPDQTQGASTTAAGISAAPSEPVRPRPAAPVSGGVLMILGAIVIGAIVYGLGWSRRRRAGGRLSSAERAAFTRRLQRLLAEADHG